MMGIIMILGLGHNYGAMLQAYALYKYLYTQGHHIKIIDYISEKDIKSNAILKKGFSPKIIVKNILNLRYFRSLQCRYKRFESFKTEYMKLTKRYSKKDMETYKEKVDLYIAGSDQIWNCMNNIEELFFLSFNTGKAKKISYAASIGISKIPENKKEKIGHLLNNFDLISVREDEAKEIIKQEFGLEATVVCDPVLLLNKKYWSELAGNVPSIYFSYGCF